MFYTLTKLQGSQTEVCLLIDLPWFYTLTKLQGSQTSLYASISASIVLHSYKITRFSNFQLELWLKLWVLHSYKITRFSNIRGTAYLVSLCFTLLQNYKVLKLRATRMMLKERFYTLTKLQGSQTGMGEMYRTISVLHSYKITRFSNDCCLAFSALDGFTLLQNYKVLKPF